MVRAAQAARALPRFAVALALCLSPQPFQSFNPHHHMAAAAGERDFGAFDPDMVGAEGEETAGGEMLADSDVSETGDLGDGLYGDVSGAIGDAERVNSPKLSLLARSITPARIQTGPTRWNEETMLTERALTRRQEGLEIQGTVPHLTPNFGIGYDMVNSFIADHAVSFLLDEARRGMTRARSVTFSHEAHSAQSTVSLVIFAEVDSSVPRTLVTSVNFSVSSGRIVTLRESIFMNIEPLIARRLSDMVRLNPEHYYAAQTVSLSDLPFFVTDELAVLLFGGFTLSTREPGVERMTFVRGNISSVTLSVQDYLVRDYGYSLKRIPLREVVEELGFSVSWRGANNTVSILQNSQPIASFTIGENYYVVGGAAGISLEEAPVVLDSVVYVPITFFDEVLPLTVYSISPGGRITFVTYQD